MSHQEKTTDTNQGDSVVEPDMDVGAQSEGASPNSVDSGMPPASGEPAAAAPGLISHDEYKALQEKLEEALGKADENWNQFLRARAELENLRRRSERELENAHKYGIEKFAREMLPIRDSLEMGVAAAQEEHADAAKLLEGKELTLKMLTAALEKFAISEINPVGEKFDPDRHEAMATQPSTEAEPNTVLHVVQKGYLLNERILRPAMVIVSRAAEPTEG